MSVKNFNKNFIEHPTVELSNAVLQNCFLGFECPTIVLQLYYC